jgi:hypothetical protein
MSGSIIVFLKESSVFSFNFIPHNHIVLILSCNWLMQVQLFTNAKGFKDVFWSPIASPPIEGQPLLNDIVESTTDFLKWGLSIENVSKHNIDVIKL